MFFSIIMFIVVSITVFSYMESSRNIKGDVERFSMQILKEANLNLERYFRDYDQFFFQVSSSGDFRRWLQGELLSDPIISFTSLKENYFHTFAAMHPEIMSVTLLNENGYENHYVIENGPALRYNYSLKKDALMSRLQTSRDLIMIMTRSNNYLDFNKEAANLFVLSICRKYDFSDLKQGYIKMDIALGPIQAILSELKIEESGSGLIVDESGLIIAHTDSSFLLTQVSEFIQSGIRKDADGFFYDSNSDQLITYRNINKTNWKIISIVPYHEVAKSVYRVKNVTILISIVGLFISLLLVILVSSSSTKQLRQLRRVMLETNLSNLGVRADITGKDEVADLGRVYNKMLANMENSLVELNRSRYVQQQAVLSALQSQINSHFLYNALESIKCMAYVANQEEIVRMTLALSDLLRYVSNYQHTMVPLREELNYVSNYLHIMQAQYGEDLSYEIITENGIQDILCLKAIIQPLVENSLKYGLEQTGQPTFVQIRITRPSEEYISIVVTDNGPGFDQMTLTEIKRKLASSNENEHYRNLSNIGLLNVHYRLRICYSDENTGVTARNRVDVEGAEISITFPARLFKEEGVIHVQNPYC